LNSSLEFHAFFSCPGDISVFLEDVESSITPGANDYN
jgi:hypothetical protein